MSQGLAEFFASPLDPQPTQGLAEAFVSPPYRGNPNMIDLLERNPSSTSIDPMPMPLPTEGAKLTPLTQGLEEAFASPLAPQPTQGLAPPPPQQPTILQIEGRSVDIPPAFYNLSEEEQSKTIELLTDQVRKRNQKVQQISDFSSKIDIDSMVQNADQSMKTYGDVSEQFALDAASSVPGALLADSALNTMQSAGKTIPAASRLLGPLAASMASAPEVKDFMTGEGEYDPQKHGISLEPILPVDVGRIPYHFNRSVFGTHDPIGSAIKYLGGGDSAPSPTSLRPTPDSPGQGYRGEI